MKRARHLGALLVATAVAAAGLVVLGQGPASAAWCSDGGVNVVVDYNSLGGGVVKGCAPSGGGEVASKLFPAAGFTLSYAQRQPGFVCRVSGKPASDKCVNASPANAYWGLFHSDGKSGKWSYANLGVGGLKVPEGGFVAFAFQDSNTTHQPDVAPVAPATPAPTPTKPATSAPSTPKPGGTGGGGAPQPGKKPSAKATRPAASKPSVTPAASPSTAATPSATPTATGSSTPSASASISPANPTPSVEPSADPTETTGSAAAATTATKAGSAGEKHSGLPVWVPLGVVAVLVCAAGAAVALRRRDIS